MSERVWLDCVRALLLSMLRRLQHRLAHEIAYLDQRTVNLHVTEDVFSATLETAVPGGHRMKCARNDVMLCSRACSRRYRPSFGCDVRRG
jgi:hypothetical protein